MDEVVPGVLVATSRRELTTSTLLVGGGEVLLIDPAWEPDELASLADLIGDLRVVAGFATHAHHDHLLWHPGFGTPPRLASERTAQLAVDERPVLEAALGTFPPDLIRLMGQVTATASLPAPVGFHPELLVHDGHAPGHTAVWLPDQRVLIAGDMLSDVELPLPLAPDDLPAYLAGLDLLAPYAARASWVIPGHGSPGRDASARLDADRRFLESMMTTGRADDPRVFNPGMSQVYSDIRRIVDPSAPFFDASG